MTHELDTRLNRRVCHVSYVPGEVANDDDELLALEEELEATTETWTPNWFVRWLERYPYIVMKLMLGVAGGCACLLYFYAPVPDFINGNDPTKGFETRGTDIHKRAWTLKNLHQHNNIDYFLAPNATIVMRDLGVPDGLLDGMFGMSPYGKHDTRPPARTRRHAGGRLDGAVMEKRETGLDNKSQKEPGFGSCTQFYLKDDMTFKFTMRPRDSEDLLTVRNVQGLCRLEQDYLLPVMVSPNGLISLPKLVMCVAGKLPQPWGNCGAITQQDVALFRFILSSCSVYYYNNTLGARDTLAICRENHQIIHQFFTFMAPTGFHGSHDDAGSPLRYVLSYIVWGTIIELDPKKAYRSALEGRHISNTDVKVVAVNIPSHDDVKYDLFSEYLIGDLQKYFVLALCLILCIMVLYTKSLALMLATVLNVAISFIFACTIYFFVFRLSFFPFINLLAGLVLIAVGADDVFIFYDTWKQVRMEESHLTLAQALSRTYSHAALSIFVTSFTTASAFFTNTVSSTITTIRCFGIFAGIAILINFFVMVTWTPACVLCIEKCWLAFLRCLRGISSRQGVLDRIESFFDNKTSKLSEALYGRLLPRVVDKLWYLCITVLLALGIGSAVVVFYKPGLQLPKSQDFQLFTDSNLLENWDLNYASAFPFQVREEGEDKVPVYIVFGFEAEDAGNWLDPEDPGANVTQNREFDFYQNETQLWLLDLCLEVKNQSFVETHYRHQPCAIHKYGNLLRDYCQVPLYQRYLEPCCGHYTAPYTHRQVQDCIPGLQVLHTSNDMMGEPVYDAENRIIGFMMFFYTELNFSMSYDTMDTNYRTLKTFFDEKLKSAPPGLNTGFFTGRYTFTFFDLQGAIAHGTYLSIAMSIAVAFIIMLLTTMNLLITLYAIVTISCAIICTVASIVLLGWDLNIIESITISLAVGLSIDFTIHYGVAYRLSRAQEPQHRVRESFSRVGSAVAMAALTTFAAGAAMMPARVIAYTKLGTFLMLVMSFSWVYATLLFQSICRIIGPRGNCCQLTFTRCRQRKDDHRRLVTEDDDDDSLITFS